MSTIDEKIKAIEDEIARTQKNKATNQHLGVLKAKIAKLKRKKLDLQFSSSASGPGYGFDVRKSGDGTVALIGLPSTGKSTLISKITNQDSKIGAYDFTTLEAIPGIMEHEGTQVQIIDLPGIIEGASKGRGRGKEVLSAARSADLILVLLEPHDAKKIFDKIIYELKSVAIRPAKKRPDISITKTNRGGLAIASIKRLTHLTEEQVADIFREYRILNALITIRDDPTDDEIIDWIEGNRVYPKLQVVINKIDLVDKKKIQKLKNYFPDAIFISALKEQNLEELKKKLIDKLELIRIYMKKQGEKTDYDEPLIISAGSTIRDICNKVHRKFIEEFRYAIVDGPSSKHPNQRVGLDHEVMDGDVVSIIVKKYW